MVMRDYMHLYPGLYFFKQIVTIKVGSLTLYCEVQQELHDGGDIMVWCCRNVTWSWCSLLEHRILPSCGYYPDCGLEHLG